MTFKTTKLRDAISFALVGATTLLTTGAAFAQEATETTATNLDRIEVTGSRIRQSDVETAQPVFTISRADIEKQGFSSVADILQNMATTGSPAISRSEPLSSGEEVGGSYVDLRGLGAPRTLVLVNGRRLGISTGGFQDVSSIPTVMVERIDVLKDGASSIYGSDAMAGVINIITRKNFDGVEASAYYGQYSEGDGAKQRYNGLLGISGERGYVTVGVENRDEDGVWARDRSFSADGYPGYPQYSNTVVGQWGNWRPSGSASSVPWNAPNRGSSALGAANFHPQNADDTSRTNDQMHLITPVKARSLFVNGGYDLTDNVRLNAEMGYNKREAAAQVAGYPLQSTAVGAPMAANSYFNPLGTTAVDWRRRGWEVPRVSYSDMTTWRFVASLEGSFDFGSRYMDWEVGSLYNDNDLLQVGTGNFSIPNVRAAVGPSFLNAQGQIQCGTAVAPIALTSCVPWNPFAGFGTGAVTNSLADPNVQKFLYPTEHATGSATTTNYFANVSGNLFTLPAGDLTYAAGYEHRKEKGSFVPDALAQSGSSTNLAAGPTQGQYSLDEFYAELNVPILADLPGAQELSVNLASRYSDYDTFGDTTNSKFGIKWKPIEDLLVRATWAEGFRAPSISSLYGGGSQSFVTGFRDPCDSVYGTARGSARCLQDVAANYRQLQQGFVPTTGPAAQTPVPFNNGSNPFLLPETSESYTAGLVYSPSFAEGLNITLDWWKIRIDETQVADTANDILSDCYVSLIESRCALFSRDPVLQIVNNLTYGERNAGYAEIEGFDFGVSYTYGTDSWGSFAFNWDSSYTTSYDIKSTNDEDAVVTPQVGFAGTFRLRSNLGASWSYGDFTLSWMARYYSSIKEECTFAELCNIPDYQAPWTEGSVVPMNKTGSTTFNDVQVRWNAPWNATISLGANNVGDRLGPILYTKPSSQYSYYGGYDIGRFIYMQYQQKF